ncbi:AGAP012524-PA [Anopheles gambiae str. PEST]|uniref:AGAP012524-PA n=1 Tax=Anopheles gambiae TaxID=7165 RepID=A0NAL1_ANOGA|nr:AGAP012524-PA [Anopheles gambiae str. PEST]
MNSDCILSHFCSPSLLFLFSPSLLKLFCPCLSIPVLRNSLFNTFSPVAGPVACLLRKQQTTFSTRMNSSSGQVK